MRANNVRAADRLIVYSKVEHDTQGLVAQIWNRAIIASKYRHLRIPDHAICAQNLIAGTCAQKVVCAADRISFTFKTI